MKKDTQPNADKVLNLTHPTAEITTLAALRSGDTDTAIHIAEMLDATDYSDPRRRVVFQACVNCLRGYEPIDDTAILAECVRVARDMGLDVQIDGGYLAGLEGEPLRAKAYATTVKRMSWLRQIGDFSYWLVGQLTELPDPDALFAEASERMQVLQPKSPDRRFVYGWETVKDHQAQVNRRIKDHDQGIVNPFNWPWSSWNSAIRPLRPGMVGLIAAPDGMGKSTYLEIVAEHWAKGGTQTVLVHLEDDLEYKLDRRLARWARVPLSAIEDGTTTPAQRAKIAEAQGRIDEQCSTLHYFHCPGRSMTDIVRELESKVAEGVCQAVVLDYLEKVQPSRAQSKLFGDNIWERQGADMEALKTFAERNRVPVFTAAQGNKSMQGDGVKTRSSISGSAQKTQKAQLVLVLTRDLVGDQGLYDSQGVLLAEPGEYSPFCRVKTDKQNRGQTKTLIQFLIGQYFDVRDIDTQKVQL